MKTRVMAMFALVTLLFLIPLSGLAIEPYSQDFESLSQGDTGALGADGWLVFANVFGGDWAYWYGYGVFPAPNDGSAFSAIVIGEGGAGQGDQQMVAFSDYNNGDHANGAHIEALVFQEQAIGAGDVGETWTFDFQAKLGNIEGASTALAFIKTLDPNAGYATTNFVTIDMTATAATWTDYSITLPIDPSLDGQLFQVGFQSIATNYEGSGIFYDNINLHSTGTVATESATLGGLKSLYR